MTVGSAYRITAATARVARMQLAITAVMAAVAFAVWGAPVAHACIWGGAMAAVPVLLAGFRMRVAGPAESAEAALSLFYRVEVSKLSLTLLVFAGAIWAVGKLVVATLVTFAACQVAWAAALARDDTGAGHAAAGAASEHSATDR